MQNIQIYPECYDDWAQPGYKEGYKAGYEAIAADAKAIDAKAFSRGVLTAFWFFYRMLNGGKPKDPSEGITRA